MARDVSRLGYNGARVPGGLAGTRSTVRTIKRLIRDASRDWIVRRRALEIVAPAPGKDTGAEIGEIFDFLSAIPFRSDPPFLELVETPQRALAEIDQGYGFGFDCDGYVTTGGALLRSIGIPIRIVLIGESAPDEYQHIYLQAFDASRGAWIAFDPSVPGAPLGWEYGRDQIASKWIESFTVADELTGPFPFGQVEAGAAAHVGALAGLGGARPIAFLGQVEVAPGTDDDVLEFAPDTEPEIIGIQPAEVRLPKIDYSNANQEIYILLTQTDADPRRLRLLFGWKRPPAARRKWRREFRENLEFQNSMPRRMQVQLGADFIKVPRPGHTDGNSVAQMLRAHEFMVPTEEAPDVTGEDIPGVPRGGWADWLPDPEELFGSGLWDNIAGGILLQNISLGSMLDADFIITGRNLDPELSQSGRANAIFVSLDTVLDQVAPLTRPPGLGEITLAGILLIIAAITGAIIAAGKAVVDIIEAARDVGDAAAAAIDGVRTQDPQVAEDAAAAIEGAHNVSGAIEGAKSGAVPTGKDWLEDLRNTQEASMAMSLARDALNRFYRDVRTYGFDSPRAALYRQAVRDLVVLGPMFYLLAKERSLRDLRALKISALEGRVRAEVAYYDLLAEMRGSSIEIASWADEYAELPFDLDHVEIPGTPSTTPPRQLPEDSYPDTVADEVPENPWYDDQDVRDEFDRQRGEGFGQTGETGAEHGGRVPPTEDADSRVNIGPGVSADVSPGAGLGPALPSDNGDRITDVGLRESIEKAKDFVSEHPIISAAGAAGAGFGIYKLIQKLRG